MKKNKEGGGVSGMLMPMMPDYVMRILQSTIQLFGLMRQPRSSSLPMLPDLLVKVANSNARAPLSRLLLLLQSSSSDQGTCVEDLPDDVLSLIMSNLGPRDALRASSASRRWLHLPSRLTELVFDSNTMDRPCPADKDSFIDGVNGFLQHYSRLQSGDPLNEFTVDFCLGVESSTHIDGWISFALRKGVRSLYLCLDCLPHREWVTPKSAEGKYIFPCHLLYAAPTTLEKLALRSCLFGQNLTTKLTSLKCLQLCFMLLTEEEMNKICCHCPNVEALTLLHCNLPSKVTITISSLTNLMVKLCAGLYEIELTDGKALTDFTYVGGTIKFNFGDAPKLTNLSFTMNDSEGDNYVFQRLHCDFPAMRSLSIHRLSKYLSTLLHLHGNMSSLLKLEVLRLNCHSTSFFSLQTALEILKACPRLTTYDMVPPYTMDAKTGVEFPIEPFHRSLKHVKITGFSGSKDNVNLVRLLIEASVTLDEVVIKRKPEVEAGLLLNHEESNRKWLGTQESEIVVDKLRSSMRSGSLKFN